MIIHKIMVKYYLSALLSIILMMAANFAFAKADTTYYPAKTGAIVDDAGVLSPSDKTIISQKQAQIQKDDGVNIYVVTIKSFGGKTSVQYVYQLSRKWGFNKGIFVADHSNNMILVIATNDGTGDIYSGNYYDRFYQVSNTKLMRDKYHPWNKKWKY